MILAVTSWNGRVSPVLDVARQVELLEFSGDRVVSRRQSVLPGTGARQQAGALIALSPGVLICGAISRPLAALLAEAGIELHPFTAGDLDEVVGAWSAGKLPDEAFAMPGCCGRPGWCGGRRRRQSCCRGGRHALSREKLFEERTE